MSESPRGQYSFPGLSFTKLERHFFLLLRRQLESDSQQADLQIFASRLKRSPTVVEMLLCRGHLQQEFRLRVYGLRPVCYQLETDGTQLNRDFRSLLFQVLGERNLLSRGGGLHTWVFQVYYPEAVVKSLS